MADKPATKHGTNKPPVRKRHHARRKAVIDDMAARSAYARAKAWADSPAGTPYGSESAKERP
jgi:hypothetical protein